MWTVTTLHAEDDSQVEEVHTDRTLWLQVYNIAAQWSSHSALTKHQVQLFQEVQRLRDEIELLEEAGKNSQLGPPESIVVLPER